VDTSVEVRYAGVVVGRGLVLRDQGAEGTFVGIPEPLPVGTLVTLKIGDEVRQARVDEVVESAEPNAVGMRVHFRDPRAATPAPRPTPAAATPAPAPKAASEPTPVAATPAPAPTAAAPAPAPADPAAPAPVPAGESASVSTAVATGESGAIPAPLSLAGAADSGQVGGKRRRKRR
jgi:pyruvate dehydrogenase E2 component (dihydrolipoyllysine-residue acetyltransferase)